MPDSVAGPRSFRLGRRVLYRRDDLDAWIDARREHASPAGTRHSTADHG
jgi:hypothetical protein